eukprot:8117909-Lingulodinium_polyedra.AAC.1
MVDLPNKLLIKETDVGKTYYFEDNHSYLGAKLIDSTENCDFPCHKKFEKVMADHMEWYGPKTAQAAEAWIL